jgi:glutamine synthetase
MHLSQALNTQGLRLMKATGDLSHSLVRTDAGLEQEFFLVDKEFVLKRPDILQTGSMLLFLEPNIAPGRTLLGAAPPRGQELSDQ